MSYKRQIYFFFIKRWFFKLKLVLKRFFNKGDKARHFYFNVYPGSKHHYSLSELAKISFSLFGKEPSQVSFFSQSKFGLNTYLVILGQPPQCFKCRETFSSKNSEKLEVIIQSLTISKIKIPPIIGRYEDLVFTPWIEGNNIKVSDLASGMFVEQLAKYQASLHSHTLSENCLAVKMPLKSQYLEFLQQRFVFFGSSFVKGQELLEVVSILNNNTPTLKVSITHPDFSFDNIILENKKPILIDNETLNVDLGFEFDILNAGQSFFPDNKLLQNYYFEFYKKYHCLGTLESHSNFWSAVYFMKCTGSAFQRQDKKAGLSCLKELKKYLLGIC